MLTETKNAIERQESVFQASPTGVRLPLIEALLRSIDAEIASLHPLP